jgi:hypothetical protein
MRPDANKHNSDPNYLRSLIKRAQLSQREAARRIGITERMMRYHLSLNSRSYIPAPYSVQFALECLAEEHS